MSPEERYTAIMTHPLTGLPNRRAMEEDKSPAWAEVDADSLKWVNDNLGEEAGNDLLKKIATALSNADGVTAYHVGGDEFYVTGETEAQIEAALKAVAKTLAGQTVEGQGGTMTPAITWGTGATQKAASVKMKSRKVDREKAGKRAGRNQKPPTAVAPRIPAAYREPGKYLFHLVRNVDDVAGIVKDGLRKGSNVSMLGGQATEMFDEGEVLLVFENPGTSKEKGYQADLLTTEALKPVAIVVDTALAEKGKGGDAVYDQLTKDYEQLEADKAAFAKKHKLDGDQLLRILVSYPKGAKYQEFKAGLNEADLKTLRDLVAREERMEKGLEGAEKAAGPAVSTMDVLQRFGQYTLPVFSASGQSYVPARAEPATVENEFPPERYDSVQPWQIALRERTDLPRVMNVGEDQVTIEPFTEARLGEPLMARVAPVAEVVAFIRKDIENRVIPENPSFGTLNMAYGLRPDDIKKVQAALAEPVKAAPKRGKKKFVPKKAASATAEQIAEQQAEALAEETAPPQRETIEIVAQNVEGQEAQMINELLGVSAQELAQEANLDKSGQLLKVLQSILVAMKGRGNWPGWFAAVTRGGVLTREQRNGLIRAIREFSAASPAELDLAREGILSIVTDVDGKTLPMEAINAVMEAATAARAYTTVASTVLQMENDFVEDANTIIEETTGTSAFDIEDGTGKKKYDPSVTAIRREGAIARARGTRASLREQRTGWRPKIREFKNAKFARAILNLSRAMNRNNFIGALMHRTNDQILDTGYSGLGSHALMDAFIARLADIAPGNTENSALLRVLTAIRNNMPDVPVEFFEFGTRVDSWLKGEIANNGRPFGGMYYNNGLLQVGANVDANGRFVFGEQEAMIFIHEAVHSATVYELERDPNSPAAQRLRSLYEAAVRRAGAKYGNRAIADVINWFADQSQPMPEVLKGKVEVLYGLSNPAEFAAEVFSSPKFVAFLETLDQRPTKPWFSGAMKQVMDVIRHILGIKNPADGSLLKEISEATIRVMQAQRARATRQQRYFMQATEHLVELGMDRQGAESIMFQAIANLRPAMPDPVTGDRVLVPPTRGDRKQEPESSALANLYEVYFDQPGAVSSFERLTTNRREHNEAVARLAFWNNQEDADGDTDWNARAYPKLRDHEKISRITTPRLADALAQVRQLMKTRVADSAKDVAMGLPTMDFLVRRWSHLFGHSSDQINPLNVLKVLRETRRSYSNQMMELAERTVNSKWMKLTSSQSKQLGDMLQETTLWQIDPEGGLTQPRLLRNLSKKKWAEKVQEIQEKWNAMSPEQQEIYRSVQKYFKTEYSKLRRASMDLAIDLYGVNLTPQQKSLLYALRNPEGTANLIGTGKPIDLGDQNDRFDRIVRDLIKVSAIKGPYFPLMRQGKYVVEAEREGVFSEDGGGPREFTTKEDAQEEATRIRSLAPNNSAVVRPLGDKFVIEYKMRYVSFHTSQLDAESDIKKLNASGFAVKGGTFTRKLESVTDSGLSGGLSELVSKAESLAGTGTQEEREAALKTIRAAFTQILAERAASASSQIKRKGVGGFKGNEAHEIFTRRVRASSWHYANLKTSVPLQRALTQLRKFSTDADQGQIPAGYDRQSVLVARGRVLSEVVERMRVEAGELDTLGKNNVDHWMGQAGFAMFLATPSYAVVNALQNFNVALPVIVGKFGPRGVRAMMRGMRVVAGPAFGSAMRGLVQKPGEITTYDVYTAIADAVAQDPRFARFTQSPDGGKTPSALQQLVDRNVINATYVQELTSVSNDQNLLVSKGMDYLRLLPQGTELWNRISTALAVLDLTNGNVDQAADMVDQVHFQYALENRPRYFRKVGGMRLPQAITMFKMYGVGMLQLGASLIVDSVGRNKTPETRRQSAMALAGIIGSHALSAGIIGGVMVEPLRALMAVWQMAFGDDDEFSDLDTMIQLWAAEVTGSQAAGKVISSGVWNALGFDLSGRLGLDRILMYNPPEGDSEDSFWKFMGSTLVGPLVSESVRRGYQAWDMAAMKGKPMEAILSLVPLKAFQDARKTWELMTRGVTTRAGEELVSPETFGVADAAGRLAGFRTSEESTTSRKASTEFRFKNWKTKRTRELTNDYWQAVDSGDEREIARVTAAITRFREKNPGVRFTAQSLIQSKKKRMEAARSRVGEGKDPAVRELLAY